ncbi:MAG: hypothetical protein FJ279_32065, partial [Planctomycetes bacterium]|nr:hypothetical protein [Planctomycetota bacterium]
MRTLRVWAACSLLCGGWPGGAYGQAGEATGLDLWGPVGQLERAVWEPDGYQGTPALRFDGREAAFVISPQELPMRHTEVAVELRLRTATLLHDQNILVGQYEGAGSTANSWGVFLDRAGNP